MLCQVVEKKFPLRHLPEVRHFVIIEANHERCDEIELLSEIRKRSESFDSLDYAANAEQTRNLPEHGQTVHIKAKSRMTQELGYIEEISCAAAKIEDALGTRQIELDLANSPYVDSDPTIEIEIFRPICARVGDGVALPNLLEPNWIDCFDNPFFVKRESTGSENP
jgi:hypothetical protein